VASNLALACAAASERVLLIDANFRRPAVHKVFKLTEGPGLGDVLSGQATFEQVVRPGVCSNLDVIAAGTPAGRTLPERLSSDAMARVLRDASTKYDRIFLDSAPAIVAGDGLMLANRCDAVVVVVRAYAEKRGLLARIRGQLADTRADFVGVVVNAVRSSAGGYFKRNIKATHQYQNNGKA
jgi:capsular exopolysaccharide synthesis family protein